MAKRILLADDSITIQKVISITFASEDYDLVIVGDGDAALRKARESRPDLIMADVAMPGKNGYELCEAVKADPALSAVPVLLLAGTFEPLNRDEALRVGADDSIVKPFESQELIDKVAELLSKSGGGQQEEGASAVVAGAPDRRQADSDLWSADDFLSVPDEFEHGTEAASGEPDLDFLTSGGLFEDEAPREQPRAAQPREEAEFTDLVINDDEFKAGQVAEDLKGPSFDLENFEPFRKDEKEVGPGFGDFEPIQLEERSQPFEVEPLEAEPERGLGGPVEWKEPAEADEPVEEQITDSDLLEIPEEVLERPEVSQPLRRETFAEPARPLREIISAPESGAARVSDDELMRTVERVAGKVEQRLIADLESRLKKAEAQVAEAVERTAARVEERLRGELASKLSRVDSQVADAADRAAARMEDRLRGELASRLEKSLAIPREQVEAIVARTSKQVVEHIAWEVLPELAERLIKAEINRVKDALVRLK